MRRLIERGDAVGLFQGDVAGPPGRRRRCRPSSKTALGVSISPSRLGSVTGWPRSSSVAMAEKVVPRSMPTTAIVMKWRMRNGERGTHHNCSDCEQRTEGMRERGIITTRNRQA